MSSHEAAPIPTPPRHFAGLDGLRGLAILAVMGHHLLTPNYPQGIPGGMEGILIKVAYRLFDVGWWGVDLFFVLSGFLITGILLEAKGSAHYFRNFYARRSLRIFPLYYGVLGLLFFVVPWLASAPATSPWFNVHGADWVKIYETTSSLQNWLWFYGANVRMALASDGWIFGTLTHFWSLAVEEHFYLVWPVVVFCCSARVLARVCLAVAVGAMVCRIGFYLGGLAPAYIYVTSPCRFDALALGAFVAVLTQLWKAAGTKGGALGRWESAMRLLRSSPPADATSEGLRVALRRILVTLLPITIVTVLTCPRFGAFVVIVGHTLFAMTFAAGLLMAAEATPLSPLRHGGWLCARFLRTFGKYSYGLYVLHPFIVEPLGRFLASPSAQGLLGHSYVLTAILRFALGLPISLLVAWVVWHGFEKHFLRLKHFFPTTDRLPAGLGTASAALPQILTAAK